MSGIWKISLMLLALFTLTFFVSEAFGLFELDAFEDHMSSWREQAQGQVWTFLLLTAILASDLVLPVPSLVAMLIAGDLLGMWWGSLAGTLGCLLGAMVGYYGCRIGGQRFFAKFVKEEEAQRVRGWFDHHGVLLIIVSRAIPMLPEVLACLAGFTKMSPAKFYMSFLLGTFPVALVCSYAGSTGLWQSPWLLLGVGLGIPALSWGIFYVFSKPAATKLPQQNG